jgi:hypothetical protein
MSDYCTWHRPKPLDAELKDGLGEARLSEIRARVEAATPGPWELSETHGTDAQWIDVVQATEDEIVSGETQPRLEIVHESYRLNQQRRTNQIIADCTFIAHARMDIPDLLDALAEAQAERDALLADFRVSVQCGSRVGRAEIERLRADAKRLDWLEKHGLIGSTLWRGVDDWGWLLVGQDELHPTVRDAIDAAMAAQEGGGHGE